MLLNHLNNNNITDCFIENLKNLERACSVFVASLRRENYISCKKFLVNDIKNSIIKAFDDLSGEFTEKYSAENYCE